MRQCDSRSVRQCVTTSLCSSANCTGWEHWREFSPSLLILCTSVCMGQHHYISPTSWSTRLISGARRRLQSSFSVLLNSVVHGCPSLVIGPSLLLLPVLGTVCLKKSTCHVRTFSVCFSKSPQGFSLQAFIPMTYHNFCSACTVTIVISL